MARLAARASACSFGVLICPSVSYCAALHAAPAAALPLHAPLVTRLHTVAPSALGVHAPITQRLRAAAAAAVIIDALIIWRAPLILRLSLFWRLRVLPGRRHSRLPHIRRLGRLGGG